MKKPIWIILCLLSLSGCAKPPSAETKLDCENAREVTDTYKECAKTSAVCAFRIERANMVLRECQ